MDDYSPLYVIEIWLPMFNMFNSAGRDGWISLRISIFSLSYNISIFLLATIAWILNFIPFASLFSYKWIRKFNIHAILCKL